MTLSSGAASSAAVWDSLRAPLQTYYRALAGYAGSRADAAGSGEEQALADLPPRVAHFADAESNTAWYKVAVTHRAAHAEFGTPPLPGLSPHVAAEVRGRAQSDPFQRFASPALGVAVFHLIEDFRVDEWIRRSYPGLRRSLAAVQALELKSRPPLDQFPVESLYFEILLRLTLGAEPDRLGLPRASRDAAGRLARILDQLAATRLRLPGEPNRQAGGKQLAGVVPPTPRPSRQRQPEGDATTPTGTHGAVAAAGWQQAFAATEQAYAELDQMGGAPAATPRVGGLLEAGPWWLSPPVSYRESLASLLQQGASAEANRSEEDGESEFAAPPDSAEPGSAPATSADQSTAAITRDRSPGEEAPDREPTDGDAGIDPDTTGDGAGVGSVVPPGARLYVYPEWDFRAGQYRRRWCSVYESSPPASPSAQVFRETLRTYGHLIPRIRTYLERMAPEGYIQLRRVEHGDDLDLDASVEALIDLRTGVSPSERIETKRERVHRDVAVAFLLDLSASTAEYLKQPRVPGVAGALSTVVGAPPLRRIIDVERQCVALLLGALEKLGDSYGIYGFSGHGRHNVDYLVIKGMRERLSNKIMGRIEQIEPIRATRMGAAIRHTTFRLRRAENQTRVLLLVSDGRPFDEDYGSEYGPRGRLEYAMHDTRVALDEARARGIRPFLLTIDQSGGDYLRQMCGDSGYEVLTDVSLLPERVLSLYAELIGH